MPDTVNPAQLEGCLDAVRERIRDELSRTAFEPILAKTQADFFGGKMLRARLLFTLGQAANCQDGILATTAAAVEMLQTASLLHDDLLDQGITRRGRPSFWIAEGSKSAVLLGDMLLALSVRLIQEALPELGGLLSRTIMDMCNAEVEQTFVPKGGHGSWEASVAVAQLKTGSLFGFAARCAAGKDAALGEVLRLSGRDLGTVYQMADDLLDRRTDIKNPEKTLGTDERGHKLTTAGFLLKMNNGPEKIMAMRLRQAEERLRGRDRIQLAWRRFVETTMWPAIQAAVGPVYCRAKISRQSATPYG